MRYSFSGDSYSAVGYAKGIAPPTPERPLGIKFPGMTWAEKDDEGNDLPNWVGHLVTSRTSAGNPLLVYDYAVGGHTVSGIRTQVQTVFLPIVGMKPAWAPWTAKDTLFGQLHFCLVSRTHGVRT